VAVKVFVLDTNFVTKLINARMRFKKAKNILKKLKTDFKLFLE